MDGQHIFRGLAQPHEAGKKQLWLVGLAMPDACPVHAPASVHVWLHGHITVPLDDDD